jgi:hypothetical protein
MGAQQLSTKL